MYIHIQNLSQVQEVPDPPATEVTNSAIALFAVVFPTQSPKVQEFALEQLTTLISAGALNRAPGRRAAIIINTALALLGATKVAVGEMSAESGDLKHPAVEKALQALLRVCPALLRKYQLRYSLNATTRALSSTLIGIYATLDMKRWVDCVTVRETPSRPMKSTLS